MPYPSPDSSRRCWANFLALDALRGMLAMYVVAGHARWLLWAGHATWTSVPHTVVTNVLAYGSAALRYGHEAVMVFFALSGFFIHLRAASSLANNQGTQFQFQSYAYRRARRILPTYYLALLLTVLLDFAGRYGFPKIYLASTGDPLIDDLFAKGVYQTSSIVPGLLGVPTAMGLNFGSNGPLWSIGYEIIYYMLYPLWLLIRARSGVGAYLAIPLAIFLVAPWITHSYVATVLRHYPIWIAGAACAEWSVRFELRHVVWPVLLAAGAAVIGRLAGLPILFATGLGTLVLLGFAVMPEAWNASRFVRWLGESGLRSYTIYAVHFPFLVLWSAILFEHQGTRPMAGWNALAGTVLAIVFGTVCFEVCERRSMPPRITAQSL